MNKPWTNERFCCFCCLARHHGSPKWRAPSKTNYGTFEGLRGALKWPYIMLRNIRCKFFKFGHQLLGVKNAACIYYSYYICIYIFLYVYCYYVFVWIFYLMQILYPLPSMYMIFLLPPCTPPSPASKIPINLIFFSNFFKVFGSSLNLVKAIYGCCKELRSLCSLVEAKQVLIRNQRSVTALS